MHRNILSILVAFFACVSCLLGSEFDDANRQFTAGNYDAAARSYEKILTNEGPDAAVYYNLGNSYQQLKNYGPAMLAYERARLLTPRDPDLLANLAAARKAVTVFEEPGKYPRLESAMNYLSRNEWSWLVAGGALVLGGIVFLRGVVPWPSRGLRQLSVGISVFAGIVIALGTVSLYQRRGESSRGMILTENSTIRISPFEKADSLGTSGPGHLVRLGERSGDFYYVEVLGNNLKGWLASKDLAAIVPKVAKE